MAGFVRWVKSFVLELRRRRVIRVAVVYATTAFVILQLGEILVEPFNLPSWTLRLVLFLLILGFPLAVGLGWVYNITEEGIVRDGAEKAVDTASGHAPFTSNGLILGLLILVGGLLLYPRVFTSEGPTSATQTAATDTAQIDDHSIAVLPFEPLSRGEESESFARGIHDDLLTRLSNISDLNVTSRTSVQRFRDSDLTLPAIADTLGVRWILEGGVQKVEDKLQVNAQLIDPRTDTHAWADDYRRDLTSRNLFAIQSEITKKIARSMEAHISSEEEQRVERRPTENLVAYRYYMQGRRLLGVLTRSEKALRKFRRALQEDSTFALAWAGVAAASARHGLYNLNSADSVSIPPKKAARRALELDPDLAEAHAALGYIHLLDQKGPAAFDRLTRALELKPSDGQAHHWIGELFAAIGQPEKALAHQKQSVKLNPLAPGAQDALAEAYLYNGRYEEALTRARQAAEIGWERGTYVTAKQGIALLHLGRGGEVFQPQPAPSLNIGEHSGNQLGMTVHAHILQGDTSAARELFDRFGEESDPWERAHAQAALGEIDAAYNAFQNVEWSEAGPHRTASLRYLYPDVLGPLRADPRYEKLIREVNQQWGLNPDGSVPE